MNIVGYARVSSREQAIKGFSVDEQERRIREYIELYYGEITDLNFRMVREEGVSAKSMNRPLISEIINQLYKHEINMIIVHNLDRLTRQVKDLHNFLELISQSGAQLVSLKENIDTSTPQGKFFVSLIVLIAQWEEDMISERTIRGLRESANQGNYSKSKVPQGYYRDPQNPRKLLIDDEKSSSIREIFEVIADGSETAFTLAAKLRKEKLLGKKWTYSDVVQLIQNKVYYGSFQFGEIELEDHSPAIVSKKLWEDANKRIGFREFKQNIYVFKNKVRCNACDCLAVQTGTTKPNGKVYLYYMCPECRKTISENALSIIAAPEISFLYAEQMIGTRQRLLKERIRHNTNERDALMFSALENGIDYEYMLKKVKLLDEIIEVDMLEKNELEESVKGISFLTLDKQLKQDLVSKYISEIDVFFPTKEINIQFFDYLQRG